MGDWALWVWIALAAGAGVFQLLKRLVGQREQQPREPRRPTDQSRSYRPPSEDMEQLRAERAPEPAPSPMDEFRELRTQPAQEPRRPNRALAGNPATEGHRISVELPPVPAATEGPSASSLQVEGPPLEAGPVQVASSVQQRRMTIAARRRPGRLRRNIRQSLASRQKIREAFVLQAVIGLPKGLIPDDEAVERP